MGSNRITELIAAETGDPVYVHLTQERLNGEVVGAYMFNGNLLWWSLTPSDIAPLPPGCRPMFVREGDRG